jgi:uncharacterized membrane protein YheB (UPF0754 family)
MIPALACIPLLSALVGWMIIRVSMYLLFHPAKPVKVGPIVIKGLIYRKEAQMKQQLTLFIKTEILALEDRVEHLASSANLDRLRPELNQHIDAFLKVRLKQEMPMIGMLIGDRTISQLKAIFMEELETLFPSVIKSYINHLKDDFDLDVLIKEKVNAFEIFKIEEQFKKNYSKEVIKLSLLAALMGFVIGCIQLLIVISFLP